MRKTNRCIPRDPVGQIYYLVDTNFLVYKLFDAGKITNGIEKNRAVEAQAYWQHIDRQRKSGKAKVFTLDVCIAEAFKTLAKKYYNHCGIFPTPSNYNAAKKRLRKEVCLSVSDAAKSKREITFHDIQTSRDIIIGIDRFFEQTCKKNKKVGVIDLMLLSTARYLMDFYGFSKETIFIITMDSPLYLLSKHYHELPATFNPDNHADSASKVFV